MIRNLKLLAAAAGIVIAATGCIKVDADFTVRPDDTVDGTAIVAVDDSMAGFVGAQFGPDALAAEMPDGAKVEPYREGGYTGSRVTFADMPLDEFNEGSSPEQLTIRHEDGRYVLSGVMDTTAPAAASGADQFGAELAEQALAGAEVRIAVAFPGTVIKTNGTLSDDHRTVTWTPDIGERIEFHAVAEDGGRFPWLPIGAGSAVVLLAAVVLLIVFRWRSVDETLPAMVATEDQEDER